MSWASPLPSGSFCHSAATPARLMVLLYRRVALGFHGAQKGVVSMLFYETSSFFFHTPATAKHGRNPRDKLTAL